MNVLIGFIILAAFLQTSFLGLNIVLLIIIARSFLLETKANYFLAFFAGILVGLLSAQNIGFWPLIFLVSVKIAHVIRKLPFSISILTFIPVVISCVLIASTSELVFLKQTINWTKVIGEIVVSIPIFIFIRFWEDKFFIRPSTVKLKIRK
jgi:hypothetical protein